MEVQALQQLMIEQLDGLLHIQEDNFIWLNIGE